MANYNVLTLSEPVTDFVATTSPETINVQCSLTEDAQRKRVWAVCKAGGVPAHPYDGVRVEAKITKPEIDDHTLLLLHMEDLADNAPIPKTVSSQGEVTFEAIAGAYGKAARFRNASYLKTEMPDNLHFPGDFTVDFRVYPLAWGSTSTNYNGLVVGMEAGGLVISREPSGLLGIAQLSGDAILDCAAPPLNEWTHIAVCRSGVSLRIFYNGRLQAQTETSLNFTASPIAIGGDHLGSYFNGYIDEFRISDAARWTSDFEPPTVAYGQQEPVKMTFADLVNGTEYGVRIFVEGKYGYQTALEGAAATATPRAGQPASVFPVGTRIQIPTQNGNKRFIIVVFDRSGYPADSFLAWSVDIYETVTIKTSNCLTVMRASLEKFYQSICEPVKSEVFQVDARWATYVSDDEWHTVTQDHAFLLSSGEMIAPGEWGYGGAESIAYLNKTNRAKGAVYFTRCAGYDRLGFQGDVINKDGGLMGHHGYSDALSYGIVPTLCLPKSMLFSLEPNPDGSYSPIL